MFIIWFDFYFSVKLVYYFFFSNELFLIWNIKISAIENTLYVWKHVM